MSPSVTGNSIIFIDFSQLNSDDDKINFDEKRYRIKSLHQWIWVSKRSPCGEPLEEEQIDKPREVAWILLHVALPKIDVVQYSKQLWSNFSQNLQKFVLIFKWIFCFCCLQSLQLLKTTNVVNCIVTATWIIYILTLVGSTFS